jgi:hypothetical protein
MLFEMEISQKNKEKAEKAIVFVYAHLLKFYKMFIIRFDSIKTQRKKNNYNS